MQNQTKDNDERIDVLEYIITEYEEQIEENEYENLVLKEKILFYKDQIMKVKKIKSHEEAIKKLE